MLLRITAVLAASSLIVFGGCKDRSAAKAPPQPAAKASATTAKSARASLSEELDRVVQEAAKAANTSADPQAMLGELKQRCPGLLELKPEDEKRIAAGQFNDEANRKRVNEARQILQDFKAELPAASKYLGDAYRQGKLTGLRLELAARVFEGHVEWLKQLIKNPK